MTRRLRSNFPRGSCLWAVRNAQWQALGIPEEREARGCAK